MVLARTGNHQEIRNCFFKFRFLVGQKIIDHTSIPKSAIKDFQKMRSAPIWSDAEAFLAYDTMQRFKAVLRTNDVDLTRLPLPRLEKPVRKEYSASVKKIESITHGSKGFTVFFNYSSEKLSAIKQMKTRAFVPEEKTWIIGNDCSEDLKEFAKKFSVPIGVSARKVMDDYSNNLKQSYSAKRVETGVSLAEPYDFLDYQTVGVEFGVRMRRTWICDEMGLGKTLQGIGTSLGVDTWPVLIICPKPLRINWKLEIEKFTKKRAEIATPKVIKNLSELINANKFDFLITNYDGIKGIFTSEVEKRLMPSGKKKTFITLNGLEKKFKGVVIDEIHELKNKKSDRFKIIKKVIDHIEFRQGLTGTPYVNKVDDLSAQLELLGKIDEFGGAWKFSKRYSIIKKEDFENGANNPAARQVLSELNTKLRTMCMIRREKHQVLEDLPDKMRRVVYAELSNQSEYAEAERNFVRYLREQGNEKVHFGMQGAMLTKMKVLQKISATGKTETIAREVKQVIDHGKKAIVFVWHKKTIEELRQYFPDLLEISGNVSDKNIEEQKVRFQDPKNKKDNLFVITYKRGGVGHTLTEASDVFFHELGWNTKDQDQAEDRAHRIGQKNQVTAHYFLGKGTIDEHVYGIIQRKRGESSVALDSTQDINTSIENQVRNLMMKNV